MDALMASLQEILKLSDEQLTAFTADFEARLPEYLRNAALCLNANGIKTLLPDSWSLVSLVLEYK